MYAREFCACAKIVEKPVIRLVVNGKKIHRMPFSSEARQALGARMRTKWVTVGAMQSTVTGTGITSGFTEWPKKMMKKCHL